MLRIASKRNHAYPVRVYPGVRSNSKNMVLMQAGTDFAIPNIPSCEFVKIPTFIHKNISNVQGKAFNLIYPNRNCGDVRKIKVSILYISYSQVRKFNSIFLT